MGAGHNINTLRLLVPGIYCTIYSTIRYDSSTFSFLIFLSSCCLAGVEVVVTSRIPLYNNMENTTTTSNITTCSHLLFDRTIINYPTTNLPQTKPQRLFTMNSFHLAQILSKRSQIVSRRFFSKGAIPTTSAVEVGGIKVIGLPHLSVS